MWKRLDTNGIVEMFVSEAERGENDALVQFLQAMTIQPWASEIYAATSLGNLRLTPAENYSEEDRYDSIHVSPDAAGRIVLSYMPRDSDVSDVEIVCMLEEVAAKLELMLIRLLDSRLSAEL